MDVEGSGIKWEAVLSEGGATQNPTTTQSKKGAQELQSATPKRPTKTKKESPLQEDKAKVETPSTLTLNPKP